MNPFALLHLQRRQALRWLPQRLPGAFSGASLTAATAALSLLSMALLLAGCASPGEPRAARPLRDAQAQGASDTSTPWPAARWWSVYGDAGLDRLVDQALAAQPSLQVTQARLQQARAAVEGVGAASRPQLSGAADLADQRFTENGLVPPPLAGATRWNNSAQVNGSWEIDLFGRQRAMLAGNVAAGYFNLARLVENRAVAVQSQKQREQVLALVRQRITAGLDTRVELRQAEGLIAQSRVEVESLDEAMARARHALAELTGQGPQALDALSPTLAPVQPRPVPAALPADLLGRRADLVAQRWRVEAATHDVAVARAQFYPNVNLVAFAGLSSLGLSRFIDAGSLTYGAGPALRLPLFDGGRLRANLGARQAEVDAAVEAYNGALLRALREVADELASLQSLERQQRAQDEATAAADAAYDLALQRYQAGLGNFLTVLTAQTNVLAQRRAATDLKGRHLASEAALARALGGGYEAGAEAPPAVALAR